ncbi:MAG: hypothetical protein ABII26_08765 [Pseudomonadota bacterium]
MERSKIEYPKSRDYAEHSRFAQLYPKEYVQHVNKALREGKGPHESNYFEDIYKRALRFTRKGEGKGSVSV